MLVAPRRVQCRSCANYLGRRNRLEPRTSERTCAAELAPDAGAPQLCESYVALAAVFPPCFSKSRAQHQ